MGWAGDCLTGHRTFRSLKKATIPFSSECETTAITAAIAILLSDAGRPKRPLQRLDKC
jgi:hypothetical protein